MYTFGSLVLVLNLLLSRGGVDATVPSVTINGGPGRPNVLMPRMAFGTSKPSFKNCSVQQGVEQWLRLGGRHIDTADIYGTQPDVGRALKSVGISRDEVFITTKIPGPIGSLAVKNKILHTALPQLGVEYLDLVLIHFPCKEMIQPGHPPCSPEAARQRLDTWAGLADLRKDGKIRALGVSNYDSEQVDEIVREFNEAPAVNQVQFHLAYHNETLLKHMKAVGTVLESWASLGGPTVHGSAPTISLGDARLKEVAARYNASTAAVALRWETQKGIVPVTASCSGEHLLGDMGSFGFDISDADKGLLDGLMPTGPTRLLVI